MPYVKKEQERDGKTVLCVYKKDADGNPIGESLGCHDGDTPEERKRKADKQIAAIYASEKNMAAKSAGLDEMWITVDDMLAACPSCGEEWQRRGWEVVNVKALSPGSLAAFCSRAGSDPGFWTKCAGLSWGPISEPAAFCVWLHHECLGKWPAEKSLGGTDHLSRVQAVESAWQEFWRVANVNMPYADGAYGGMYFSDVHAVELDEKYVVCAVGDKLYKIAYTDPDGSIVFDAPDKWTPMQVEYTPTTMPSAPPAEDDLVAYGGEVSVKSLSGNSVLLETRLVRFSSKDDPDYSPLADYFDGRTNFGQPLNPGGTSVVWYDHGNNKAIDAKPLGMGDLERRNDGIWLRHEMQLAEQWQRDIAELARRRLLRSSSGAPKHLVRRTREDNGAHHIDVWPLGADASYTVHPADTGTPVGLVEIKSLPPSRHPSDLLEAQPEAGDSHAANAANQGDGSADTESAAKSAAPSQENLTEVIEMEYTQEQLDKLIADGAAAAVKAVLSAPAQPLAHGAGTVTPGSDQAYSIGDAFTRSRQYTSAMKAMGPLMGEEGGEAFKHFSVPIPGGFSFIPHRVSRSQVDAYIKAMITSGDTSAGTLIPPDRTTDFDPLGHLPFSVLAILSQRQTSSNLVQIPRQVSQFTSAGMVAEADDDYDSTARKPEGSMELKLVDAPVRAIAERATITRFALDDAAEIRSTIDTDLTQDIRLKLEDQVLNGDGLGQNLLGVNNTPGILTQAFDTDLLTTYRKAITKLVTVGKDTPNYWVLNPIDLQTLELLQDGTGAFYYGGPAMSKDYPLWRIPIIWNVNQPEGTALLGNWTRARLYEHRTGTRIFTTDSNREHFEYNVIDILGELRAAFVISRLTSFVKVTLTEP